MSSFEWKCKRPKLQPTLQNSEAFSEENQVDPGSVPADVDWLSSTPHKKRKVALEDAAAKAQRLVEEGTILASNERHDMVYAFIIGNRFN